MAKLILLCKLLLMLLSQVVISSALSFSSLNPAHFLCPHEQSQALIQFKNPLSIDRDASYYCGESYPKTESWKEGTDCCSWKGVKCDAVTGYVIGLDLSCSQLDGTIPSNSTLFHLLHLQSLNLAFNNLTLSSISSNLPSLTRLNLSASQFTGGLVPFEISQLSKLISLDLSQHDEHDQFKNEDLKFDRRHFQMMVQNLTDLKELILDHTDLSSVSPTTLQNLSSSLTSLGLKETLLRGTLPDNVFRLPNLQYIDLAYNFELICKFPKSNWSNPLRSLYLYGTVIIEELPDSIGNLKSLETLDLTSCGVQSTIPTWIGNLTRLIDLGLANNNFTGQLPRSLSELGQLTELDLSSNRMGGDIPDVFGNLTKLSFLFLKANHFTGPLPLSILNLTKLVYIDFSSNHLGGTLPDHTNALSSLERIDLSGNLFTGKLPSWLFTLPSIAVVSLDHNKFTGISDQLHEHASIQRLYLANNELVGLIPNCVFELVNLTVLDLSSNKLSGIVESDKLSKLKNLESLDLSSNSLLSFKTSNRVNHTFPKLYYFAFSSCNINEFPNFGKQSLEKLIWLDLSDNGIHGVVNADILSPLTNLIFLDLSYNGPLSFETKMNTTFTLLNLQFLSLSFCNITEFPSPFRSPKMEILELSNNAITKISKEELQGWHRLFVLDLSSNKLTGPIPTPICNLSSLDILDFSHNSFSGKIPECLGNMGNNRKRKNKLNSVRVYILSSITGHYYRHGLRTLNLHGNLLKGPLPRTLANSTLLTTLDVGSNKINDMFPYWLGTLPQLQILTLRSNSFHGPIETHKANNSFPALRIFDLSYNKFTGMLPIGYFGSWKVMMNVNEEVGGYMPNHECMPLRLGVPTKCYYEARFMMTMKGLDTKFQKIHNSFMAIDMSSNRFHGQIPKAIGKLTELRVLNFSHNRLSGPIPVSLENLTVLESLDLSSNRLSGEIPKQLADLPFLSKLNLSQNMLVGPIPVGKQFNTFDNDSYAGNLGLCGPPLTKKCGKDEAALPPVQILQQEDSTSDFDWETAIIGYSCGMVIGVSLGYIVFATRKPEWFVRMVEGAQRKISYGRSKGRRGHC